MPVPDCRCTASLVVLVVQPGLPGAGRRAPGAARCPRTSDHDARRLLCLSRAGSDRARAWRPGRRDGMRAAGFEQAVEVASDVALEASLDLAWRLAVGHASGGVGACGGVVLQSGEHDRVQRAVEIAVA